MATVDDRGSVTGPSALNRQLELAIGGMTCASCAARIEKKLNKLQGVRASVNYATEKARVDYAVGSHPRISSPPWRAPATPRSCPPRPAPMLTSTPAHQHTGPAGTDLSELRVRLLGSAVLAVPVVAMSMAAMVPGWQVPREFDGLSLFLTAPVVTWGAWPFHRAAWQNLRHGAATMDTLVSMGVLTAFLWSCYA